MPGFAEAHDWLKQALENGGAIDEALHACLDAPLPRDAQKRYREVGELALRAERWEMAEWLAIRSLRHQPSYGAAFKLLGLALRGAGHLDEAAVCHRYGLPPRVRDKHFGDLPCVWTNSRESADAGIERHEAYAARSWPLRAPVQVRPREIVELSASELHVQEAVGTFVPDGRLWFDGFNTVIWDRQGRIVRDLCRGYAEVVHGSLDGREARTLEGRVCLLGNRNATNYYHWMNDVLPRLEVLQASGWALDEIDRFVVGPLRHAFQRETLAAFGIGEERLHTTDLGEYIEARELLIPTYGSNSLGMGQGPWNPAFLKRCFVPEGASGRPATRRLYVSRGSDGARGVSNDAELAAYLVSVGFETVRTERLTVCEQAALFDEAEAVIGPHGAGFSNIAFCRPGTRVVELFNAHVAPCFWVISELTGLEHAVHFCGEFDESSRPSDNERYHRSADDRRRSSFHVDVDEVAAMLGSLGVS